MTLSFVCPHCSCFLLENYTWWVSSGHGDGNDRNKKQCSWWCAACGGPNTIGELDRILVVRLGANATEAKVFRARSAARALSQFDQRFEVFGESAETSWWPNSKHCHRPAPKKSKRHHKRAKELRRSKQPQCCGRGRLAPRY